MTGMPTQMTVEDIVRSLLAETMHARMDPTALGVTDDLYGAGLSSLGTVDLMLAVEDRFDLEFTTPWLNRRTFGSIAAIAHAVRQLQGAGHNA